MIIYLILALFLKILIIVLSQPLTNFDLESYRIVGQAILQGKDIYLNIAKNHYPYLPFYLYFEAIAVWLSQIFSSSPSFFLKILNLVFDLGLAFLIYHLTRKNLAAFIFYLFSPITNLIFYFHGQFDVIPLFFILLSIYFIKNKNQVLSVITYSLAILSKSWPIFFVLPLVKKLKNKKNLFIFFILFVFFLLSYRLLFGQTIIKIIKVVISYRSLFNFWGLGKIISLVFFNNQNQPPIYLQKILLFLFLLIFFIYSFIQKTKKIELMIFQLIIIFYISSFGFSLQYLSWFVPFLVIIRPKYWQRLYFLISLYLIFNYAFWLNKSFLLKQSVFFLNLISWFSFLIFMVYWQKKGFKKT